MPKCTMLVVTLLIFCALHAQLPALIPFNDHGKWGYSDSNGVIKIKPQWKAVSFFYPNGMAWVELEKVVRYRGRKVGLELQRGIIDMNGVYIISPHSELSWEYFVPDKNYFLLQLEESVYSLFDIQGSFICENCVRGDSIFTLNRVVFNSKKHRYGLKDAHGKVRTKRHYSSLSLEETREFSFYKYCKTIEFGDTMISEIINKDFPLWKATKGSRNFLIDSNGKEVVSWRKRNLNTQIDYCGITKFPGVYFGGIKQLYPMEYIDSSILRFSGTRESYSCKKLYLSLSQDNFNNIVIQLFNCSNFYLIDCYGRKYAKF